MKRPRPVDEQVEASGSVGEVSGQIMSRAMKQAFQVKDAGQETENGLNNHPFTPGLYPTDFQVLGSFTDFDKASVTEGNRLLLELVCQGTKALVMDVCSIPVPGDNLSLSIDQPAQLGSYNPTPIRLTFLAQRLLTTRLTCRVQQLDPVTVDD